MLPPCCIVRTLFVQLYMCIAVVTVLQIYSMDLHLEDMLYAFHLPLNTTHILVSERLLFTICHIDETEMVRGGKGRGGRRGRKEGEDEREGGRREGGREEGRGERRGGREEREGRRRGRGRENRHS